MVFITTRGGDDKATNVSTNKSTTTAKSQRSTTTVERSTTTAPVESASVLSCSGAKQAAIGVGDLSGAWKEGKNRHPDFTDSDCVEVEPAASVCPELTLDDDVRPTAEWEADFSKPGTGESATNGVVAYSTLAEARRVMELAREGADACREIDAGGFKGSVRVVPFDSLGDETLALRLEVTSNDRPPIYADIIYIRKSTATTVAVHYADKAAPLDDGLTRQMATTAIRKLESALAAAE